MKDDQAGDAANRRTKIERNDTPEAMPPNAHKKLLSYHELVGTIPLRSAAGHASRGIPRIGFLDGT